MEHSPSDMKSVLKRPQFIKTRSFISYKYIGQVRLILILKKKKKWEVLIASFVSVRMFNSNQETNNVQNNQIISVR